MIRRLALWWQHRALRSLERNVVRHADAALKAHARGDHATYLKHANAARTRSDVVRALRSVR